jgi:hypothetical protein
MCCMHDQQMLQGTETQDCTWLHFVDLNIPTDTTGHALPAGYTITAIIAAVYVCLGTTAGLQHIIHCAGLP